MEGVNVSRNTTNVSVNGLANACIEAHDFIEGEAGNTSIVATGPLSVWNGPASTSLPGRRQETQAATRFRTAPTCAVFDTWYDNGAGGNCRWSATGGGAVTFFGGTAAEGGTGAPAFSLNNFTGNAALVGGGVSGGGISFSGSGASANDLVLGMPLGSAASSDSLTANPPATYGFLHNQSNIGAKTYLTDQSNFRSTSFLVDALHQAAHLTADNPREPAATIWRNRLASVSGLR